LGFKRKIETLGKPLWKKLPKGTLVPCFEGGQFFGVALPCFNWGLTPFGGELGACALGKGEKETAPSPYPLKECVRSEGSF